MSFLAELRANLDTETWLPDEFKEAIGLSALSIASQGRVSLKLSKRRYYPNLFTLLIGESGSGKGIGIHDTLEQMITDIDRNLLLPKIFTPEGLLVQLSEQPIGIVCNDEIGTILSSKKYQVGMAELFTELYNCPMRYSKRLVNKTYTVNNPYLCLSFGTQPTTLENFVTDNLMTSGFLPRFLLIFGDKQKPIQTKKDKYHWHYALMDLERIYNASEDTSIELKIDGESINMVYNYSEKFQADLDMEDKARLYYTRMNDAIIKFSMLYWLNDSVDTIYKFYKVDKVNKVNRVDNVQSVCNVDSVHNVINEENNLRRNVLMDSIDTWTLSTLHVKKAIEFYDKIAEGHQGILRTILGSIDTKNTELVRRAVEKIVERGKTEILNGCTYIRNRDILKHTGMTNAKLKPYIEILMEEGMLGTAKIVDRKKIYKYIGGENK